tara:strand:- start:133 stop:564 length:432 start_codon:yes stop_codon:yes gene_type:complete
MSKTFRGLIADGEVKKIRLSTADGMTGYKIKKFRIMPETPYSFMSGTVTVSKNEMDAAASGATINFNDPNLLAAGSWVFGSGEGNINDSTVFDAMVFNQDIYIAFTEETTTTFNMNYYLELEQIKLDLNEQTVATLKDMRGRE